MEMNAPLRRVLHTLGWLGHWLPGALLALLLAGGVAGWIWSGRDGSLPQVLGWAQAWLDDPQGSTGRLQVSGAQGSLRGGGQVQQLRWTRQGLDLRLQGLRLRWSTDQIVDALLLRRLQTDALHLDRLDIDDQRPPSTHEPLNAAELPLPVNLDWAVDTVQLSGRQQLRVTGLRGHYRYGPAEAADRSAWGQPHGGVRDAHRLRVDAIELAQGRYQLQAVLGAQAPMPLHAAAQGQVLTQVPGGQRLRLPATASASGTVAGPDAVLDVQAQVRHAADQGALAPASPVLAASARVHPWATQPLHSLDAQAHRLDLASLWPQAPTTALTGRVTASPEAGAWHARLDLRNERSGPWDQQRLPLDTLLARVEQHGAQWQVPEWRAALGHAQLQGSAQYQPATGQAPAQWQGQLQGRALNPAQLWSSLAPAALDLRASAQQTSQQPGIITLQALVQDAQGDQTRTGARLRELRLQGQWHLRTRVLQLDEAVLDAAQARLVARGALDLNATSFNGSSTLSLPGAEGHLDGLLAPDHGQGSLNLRVDALDRLLAWAHGLQSLPVLGPALRQTLAQWPAVREGSLRGQANLQTQWRHGLADLALQLRADATQGPWTIALQTQGQANDLWPWPTTAAAPPARLTLDTFTLRASDATRRDRVLDWSLRSTQPLHLSARSAADGLSLQAAAAQLELQPALRPSGTPSSSPQSPPLPPLVLAWDTLAWQGGTLLTRGRLQGLPLAWVDPLSRAPDARGGPLALAGLSGDLLFDGAWDLQLPLATAGPAQLSAQLQRRSGDLAVLTDSGEPGKPVNTSAGAGTGRLLQGGIRDASLQISAQGRDIKARLRWDSERLGQASADLSSERSLNTTTADGPLLERWWPAASPLSGSLSARLPQVGVWSALAPPGWRMRGTLGAEATLTGTRSAPDWRGSLQADQLALRSVVDGFEFSQGQLRATLAGERMTIDRFELQGPLGGSLSASGQAQWRKVDGRHQPQIDLQLNAHALRISGRADRRLTLSGQASAQLNGARLNIRGQFKADSALFVLPDQTTPALGSDVVVRGGRNLPPIGATAEQVQPDVSVQIDLGPQFEVRGRGLQARLTGQLSLRSTPAQPTLRVFGEVRTATGSYRAYGQNLQIENGALIFNGPYDDPALDILAIRPQSSETSQRVGVQINGTAQGPRVRLVATPELPDADKLAWLVLGRPASGGGAEAAVLQQAAMALLAGNDRGFDGGLARALGLDEISYRSESVNTNGSTSAAAVTLGKRISNELYLSYQTGLAGAMGTVSVYYDVSRRFTLRARAGGENAVDLIFTLQYD